MSHPTWGGRFKKSMNPMMSEFNASLPFDHVLFSYDILGSQAHARMLAQQNLITIEEYDSLCHALDEIHTEFSQGIPMDSLCEDIHMLIEQKLIEKIGDTGKKLHTGRSRNDQVALDLKLYTRDQSHTIKNLLEALIHCLTQLAQKHKTDQMPGYTHLQQAQPITLGTYFEAYQHMFTRDLSRLSDWYNRMNTSPLGAGALAGSQLPLDRLYAANLLGFQGIVSNTLDAVSDRDFIAELLSLSSIIMMHLSRLCEDLIIWATQEFGFITLDDAWSTGSSLMPNKKNPDVLELIRGKTGRVYGHLMGMLTLMKAQPMAYNKDLQEDKEGLFDTVNTLTRCLTIMTPFLEATQFNTQIMHERTHAGYLNATHMLEQLVLQGVPFRDAHHQVGLWVAQAMEQGCSLLEISRRVGKDASASCPPTENKTRE